MNFYAIYSTGADRLKRKSLPGRNPAFIRINPALFKVILMRVSLIIVLLTVGLIQVHADSFGQQVSLNVKNAAIKSVIKQVQTQTGYSFLYTDEMLNNAQPVTVNLKNATIEETLQQIFNNQPLTFDIQDKTVILQRKQPSLLDKLKNALNLDKIEVTGKVVGENNQPLVGATITVKGTNNPTITDAKGNFILKNVASNSVIVISFIGYDKMEVPAAADLGTIKLKVASNKLDAVQVIAYGETSERLNTGDVSTITSKEIETQPVENVLQAMEGRIPGLYITQSSGLPGSSFNVQIRGQNSIANGNDPFYVIDGVPYTSSMWIDQSPAGGNPLEFINPSDIENVSVLKDADATAIYGSRAANGAILITTKKGKAGKTKLAINVNRGVAQAPLTIDWLNSSQYVQMREDAFRNDGEIPNAGSAPELLTFNTNEYTNWQKLLLGGTAQYTDVQASVSGGNANTQFLIGGGYQDQSTVFPFSESVPHVSTHFNITNTSDDKKFKIDVTGSYTVTTSQLPASDLTTSVALPPDTPPIYNKDGSIDLVATDWGGLSNPFAFKYQQYSATTNNLVGNALLSYNLIGGLDVKSSFGYTNMQYNDLTTIPIASQDPSLPETGSSRSTTSNTHTWIVEPQLTYHISRKWGNINTLLGSTFEENTLNGQVLSGSGFTSDALIQNIQAAPILQVQSVVNDIYKYNALFVRLNYNYQDKYLLDLNWRRDGSSRFGSNDQLHDFGSIGGAWIFTKENSISQAIPWLSFGKLRVSYGTTGNDQIGDYKFYSLYQTTVNAYQGSGGLTPTGISNPNLQWEETKKTEGGVELGFLKDRITFQASYYCNLSSNELLTSPLPSITGFTSLQVNLPATVQNTGWEFVLNTQNIKSRSFSWKSSFNLTAIRNKLLAFPGIANSSYYNSLFVGQSIETVKVYNFAGVNPQNGVYQFLDNNGSLTSTPSSIIDQTVYENSFPKFYGGFQNSLAFKGWQLDIFFNFIKRLGPNPLLAQYNPPGSFGENQIVAVLNSWKSPGDIASIEKFTQDSSSPAYTAYQNAKNSSDNYVDASFIRLSNLSFSYQFSGDWLKRMNIQNLKVFVHGQNLLTITKYKGMDPETLSLTALPPLRILTAGISLSL